MYFCIVDDTNYDDAYCIHENVCVCCTLYETRWRKMILKYGLWFCIAHTLHNHYTYGDWRWGFFSFAGWIFFWFCSVSRLFFASRHSNRANDCRWNVYSMHLHCFNFSWLFHVAQTMRHVTMIWFVFLRCNSSLFYLVGRDLDFSSIWSVEMVCFSSLSLFLGVNEHPLSPPSLLDYVLASLCG